jgi:hypothetical protein
MKYIVIALLALILGGLIGHAIWGEKKEPAPVDPVQVIVTQLKTHAIVAPARRSGARRRRSSSPGRPSSPTSWS